MAPEGMEWATFEGGPSDWHLCPSCGDDELEGGPVEIGTVDETNDQVAIQEMACLSCGYDWVEMYKASHREGWVASLPDGDEAGEEE